MFTASDDGGRSGTDTGGAPSVEVWRRIVDRATQLLGPVYADVTESQAELGDAATGIRLVLSAGSGTITVPYGARGDAADELLRKLYGLGAIVEEETGLVGYDPQVGRPLRSVTDLAGARVSFDLVAGMFARAEATRRRAAQRRAQKERAQRSGGADPMAGRG